MVTLLPILHSTNAASMTACHRACPALRACIHGYGETDILGGCHVGTAVSALDVGSAIVTFLPFVYRNPLYYAPGLAY